MNPIHPALAALAGSAREKDFAGVEHALAAALANAAWLRPEHRVGDPMHYMRHVLYVAEGELTEEQFSLDLVKIRTSVYRAGETADQDLHGRIVHRVSNRGAATLVSLHLYGVSADKLTTGINRLY